VALKELKEFEPLTHLNYDSETFSEDENVESASSLNEKQDDKGDWKPIAKPKLEVLQEIEKPIQAIKTGLEIVYTPVEALLKVIETITSFLGKTADPIKGILEPIRDQIYELIDQLGGTGGVYAWYKMPFDLRATTEQARQVRTADEEERITEGYERHKLHQVILNKSQKMDEFWKQFRESFKTDKIDEEIWIPDFKADEYVVGLCILVLLPSYKEALESLQGLLAMLNVPLLAKHDIDTSGEELARLEADMYFTRVQSFVSEEKYKTIRVRWNAFRFPHRIVVKSIKFKDLKTNEEKDITAADRDIQNAGPEWTLDQHDIEIVGFEYGREYKASVELYVQETIHQRLVDRSIEVSEIVGYGEKREPKLDEPFDKLVSRTDVKIRTPFKLRAEDVKGRFFGNAAEGEWFGASINTLLPEIYQLKYNLKTLIDNFFNQMVEKVTAVERISQAITRKIEKITAQIQTIRNQIFAILDKMVPSLDGVFVKYIPLQLGGTQQLIRNFTNTKGIPQKQLIDSNFVASAVIMGGGKDAFQVETIIDFIRMLFPQDDGEPDPIAVMVTEENPYLTSTEQLEDFDLTGIDNDWKPILEQPFEG